MYQSINAISGVGGQGEKQNDGKGSRFYMAVSREGSELIQAVLTDPEPGALARGR